MNVQKIFNALMEDQGNSALGIICTELENQSYQVELNGIKVTGVGFFNDEHNDIEQSINPLNVTLFKNDQIDQKFVIEFVDFHEIIIKK
ncbi:MAG TPA: hypothetical protein PKZ42_10360 [Syntrophales bacterium]|nr:hypothetical protein [Syntrophales bacterium]